MATIIKKGTNPSAFRLRSGKTVLLNVGAGGGEFLNIIDDALFAELMAEYGEFIRKRIITDANPDGCFIVHENMKHAADAAKEIGEIKDASAPAEVPAGVIKAKNKKGK